MGIALLEQGYGAEAALKALIAGDDRPQVRQVALVDKDGKVAVHSGSGCIPYFGHRTGQHYSVQANMMAKDTVPAAMAAAFEKSSGHLAERMMAAMEAAQAEGGDIRGSQSAAMIIYGSDPKPHWANRVLDLRVDESKDPISELRRIVNMRLADIRSDAGDELAKSKDLAGMQAKYAEARKMTSDSTEMTFWQALVLADNHNLIDEARALLQPLFKSEPQWEELLRRLVKMGPGILDHPDVVEKVFEAKAH
jgi:uncharacterized Ntn-hydrolase superfamily protein